MRLKLKVNLDPQRSVAYVKIDTMIETARLKIVTPGSGQAMVYQQKYEEALAFVANPAIDPLEVPHIYGEIGITAPSAFEVAQVILNLRDMWREVSAQLEHVRLSAKRSVELAGSLAEIEQVVISAAAAIGARPAN